MDEKLYTRLKQLSLEIDGLAGEGKPVCVAVTDSDLALLFLLRQPGARVHIEHMAIGKAYTSARMGCTTEALHQRLVSAGIGVSGRLPEEDEVIALAIRDFLTR